MGEINKQAQVILMISQRIGQILHMNYPKDNNKRTQGEVSHGLFCMF